MANLRISQLPSATPLEDSDLFAIVQGTGLNLVTRRVTLDSLKQNIVLSGSLLNYKGSWNASTNTPTIPAASSTNKGWYYVVSVGGNTNIDGITDWQSKDWLVSNGTTWDKIDNSEQYLVDITHANLLTNITNGTLIPGLYYRITDFQTVHVIPETNVINTGSTEALICLAISTNKIESKVFSALFPLDTIEYDVSNVLAEDNTTARKGKIVYRKDNLNNLETWYDFRNVKFRRWIIDGTGMTAWSASTVYNRGAIVYVASANGIYKAMSNHTSDANFSNDFNNYKWVLMFNLPTAYLAWKPTLTEFGNGITTNPTLFQDIVTFAPGSKNTSIPLCTLQPYNNIVFQTASFSNSFGSNCRNITISSGSNLNTYGNESNGIICIEGSEFNDIGENCYGLLLSSGAKNNIFHNECNQIIVSQDSNRNTFKKRVNNLALVQSSANNTIEEEAFYNVFAQASNENYIGAKSSGNILIQSALSCSIGDNSNNNTIKGGSINISIGNSSSSNFIDGSSSNCSIGEFSSSNTIRQGAAFCRIGKNSNANIIESGSAENIIGDRSNSNIFQNSSSNNKVGNNSSGNTFNFSSVQNCVGDFCNGNVFSGGASNNTLEDHCNNNSFLTGTFDNVLMKSCFNNILGFENYASTQKNTFFPGCNNITLIGNNNIFSSNCSFLQCLHHMLINQCFFSAGVNNITFNSTNLSNQINELKIMLANTHSYNLVQNLNTSFGPIKDYSSREFNMKDPNGELWCSTTNNAGKIKTVKLT